MTERVRAGYVDIGQAEWAGSPFNWIRQIPSAHKKGKIGEALVIEWARSEGLAVNPRRHRGHDCVIAGLKVEVKTSLRWNNDCFVFLQLRDFDYDAVALLGLAPDDFGLWVIPKSVLWDHAQDQLRGASGKGSKWLSFLAGEPPVWLRRWGGLFTEARIALEQARTYVLHEQDGSSTDDSLQDLSPEVDWSWLDRALRVGS